MNKSGENTQQQSSKGSSCGIAAFLPLGMSCRDRAEAFARRLQTKLRTLGSQDTSTVTDSELSYLNESRNSHCLQQQQHSIIDNSTNEIHQKYPIESTNNICYNYEIELASPASPTDEYNYRRLFTNIPSRTPSHSKSTKNDTSKGSTTITQSKTSLSRGSNSSDSCCSSSDVQYFDPDSSESEQRSQSLSVDFYDCFDSRLDCSENVQNGRLYPILIDSDSCSESLPNSQSTTTSLSAACTPSSSSNYTLRDNESFNDLCHYFPTLKDGEPYDGGNDTTSKDYIFVDSSNFLVNGNFKGFNDLEKYSQSIFKRNLELDTPFLLNNKQLANNSPTPETSPECDDLKLTSESNQKQYLQSLQNNSDSDEMCYNRRPPPPRLRRSSSLKSGKTPPGTPGQKKIVRFADVLGLDLADVKTFLDEVPTVPQSAYEDLEVADQLDGSEATEYIFDKILKPLFDQPGGRTDFMDIVRNKYVCLENAIVSDACTLTITGCIRVRNLDFSKSVHLRYTLDGWSSFADFQANYIENSCDGFSDKFQFTIFGNSLQIGDKLEMAVRYSCKGQQYWDNNLGVNYCFLCVSPQTMDSIQTAIYSSKNDRLKKVLNPQNSWEAAFY